MATEDIGGRDEERIGVGSESEQRQYSDQHHRFRAGKQARHAMSLLKFFLSQTSTAEGFLPDQWRKDPLSHPDLVRMTSRELADLPLSPAPKPQVSELPKCA